MKGRAFNLTRAGKHYKHPNYGASRLTLVEFVRGAFPILAAFPRLASYSG